MNNKYWEEEIETMPREKLRELQLQRLKRLSILQPTPPIIEKFSKSTILQQTVSGLWRTSARFLSLQKPICAPTIHSD